MLTNIARITERGSIIAGLFLLIVWGTVLWVLAGLGVRPAIAPALRPLVELVVLAMPSVFILLGIWECTWSLTIEVVVEEKLFRITRRSFAFRKSVEVYPFGGRCFILEEGSPRGLGFGFVRTYSLILCGQAGEGRRVVFADLRCDLALRIAELLRCSGAAVDVSERAKR